MVPGILGVSVFDRIQGGDLLTGFLGNARQALREKLDRISRRF
jgi:hypothetical protein